MAITSNVLQQAGVVAVKDGRICLVTSRSGRRWVVPKGCREPGQSTGETALQEAWEEAGLSGVLSSEPVGSYLYEKAGTICHVTLYRMEVSAVADQWPESGLRGRCWASFADALTRVEEPGLREVIRNLQDNRRQLAALDVR